MRLLLSFSCIWLLSSCAHQGRVEKISKDVEVGRFLPTKLPKKIVVEGDYSQSFEKSNHNIPHEMNRHVKKWVRFFQGRGRGLMGRYLSRMGRYQALMEEVLEQYGVPRDLIYVALIESGFSSHAKSHASAVGYWQFIKGTGKHYGLRINHLVDERRDPLLATIAAAKYLKGLYHVFGSWYLAMASYNTGENRVKRVVMQNYTRDFWELVRKKKLPRETLNYVPKFLAAREIAKHPRKYGFVNIKRKKPLEFSSVTLSHSVSLRSLARQMEVSYSSLKRLNPQFRTHIAPVKNNRLSIRVPKGMSRIALNAAHKSRLSKLRRIAQKELAKGRYYRVRKGDYLTKVARKFRVSTNQLKKWNHLSRRSVIRIGQRLVVRAPVVGGERFSRHRVIRGDSLHRIAKKYKTTISTLCRLNDLNRKYILKVGQVIKVPFKRIAPRNKSYVVKRGDTLLGIANRHGVSITDLTKTNRLARSRKIYVGSRLLIPGLTK